MTVSEARKSDGAPARHSAIRRILTDHVRPRWAKILMALVCMALAALMTGALAQIMEPVIDEVFTARNEAMLWPIAAGVLAIFLVKGLSTYGHSVLMNDVGREIVADLQAEMFGRLIHADLASIHMSGSGPLVSRFIYDAQLMFSAVANAITGIGKDALTVVVLIGVMFHLDWQLGLVAFFVFPAAFFPIVRLGRRMRRVTRTTQSEYGQLTTALTQVFQGIRHVKAYNGEERESRRVVGMIRQVARLAQKAARIRSMSSPIMEFLGGVAIVGTIVYGGTAVIAGDRTAGEFFAFITALLFAYEPMKRLANLNTILQQGLAAADRVFETIDQRPTIVDRPGAVDLERVQGRVEFEDVRFVYGSDQPALNGVSFAVPAGRTAAIVGPSGAGKSTILNLIPRFYEVSGGRVMIDGQDVRDVTMKSLRSQIALVSQDVTLFDDTVKANIGYGRPDASLEEIRAAAEAAAAHEFILSLPDGYDTLIGENGVRLSGGQRQRLSIARAMLKNAPILLLDEATSALDTQSERQVQEALGRLMVGRTTLVVAHRLSTVRDADVIFVLDRGRVVEEGSHGELIARGGLYRRLWTLQTASEPEPAALAQAADREP